MNDSSKDQNLGWYSSVQFCDGFLLTRHSRSFPPRNDSRIQVPDPGAFQGIVITTKGIPTILRLNRLHREFN